MELSTSHVFFLHTSKLGILVSILRLRKWVPGGEVTCCGHEAWHMKGQDSNQGYKDAFGTILPMPATLLPSFRLIRAYSKVMRKEA